MSWLKFLQNIGNAESTRESIRQSYKKHFELAALARHGSDCHSVALYGALATRYRLMKRPVVEVEIWAELAPFLGMLPGRGVEALAEYIVYQERPGEARTSWLKEEINNALMLRGPHLQFAVFALGNRVLWTNWLNAGTKRNIINGAATEVESAQRGTSIPSRSMKQGAANAPGNTDSKTPASAEPALKYNLDKLLGGISSEKAIEILLSACNKPDTMFVTEQWIKPRLEELRANLSNPISSDQAQALQDTILQRCPFKDVLGWLRGETISWKDYHIRKKALEAEAKRAKVKEARKRWENRDSEKLAHLRAAGFFIDPSPEAFIKDKDGENSASDAEANRPLRGNPDPTDWKS